MAPPAGAPGLRAATHCRRFVAHVSAMSCLQPSVLGPLSQQEHGQQDCTAAHWSQRDGVGTGMPAAVELVGRRLNKRVGTALDEACAPRRGDPTVALKPSLQVPQRPEAADRRRRLRGRDWGHQKDGPRRGQCSHRHPCTVSERWWPPARLALGCSRPQSSHACQWTRIFAQTSAHSVYDRSLRASKPCCSVPSRRNSRSASRRAASRC